MENISEEVRYLPRANTHSHRRAQNMTAALKENQNHQYRIINTRKKILKDTQGVNLNNTWSCRYALPEPTEHVLKHQQ